MYTVIQSQDTLTGLVTLDEAKVQCRLLPSYTLDDADLTHITGVACELAQTFTRKLLTPGVIQAESDDYRSSIPLPWGNVSAINEVLLDDVADTEFTFSTTTGLLKPSRPYSNIKVNYNAGYTSLPLTAKHGILMMISTMYDNKEDFIANMSIEKIPLASVKLLNAIKEYHV